jgi:hypothetical protein
MEACPYNLQVWTPNKPMGILISFSLWIQSFYESNKNRGAKSSFVPLENLVLTFDPSCKESKSFQQIIIKFQVWTND